MYKINDVSVFDFGTGETTTFHLDIRWVLIAILKRVKNTMYKYVVIDAIVDKKLSTRLLLPRI